MNEQLAGMTCPKCGSEDWKEQSGLAVFLTGLGLTGCGLWLVIILIGIPMVVMGIAMMSVGPFAGTVYVCNRCHKSWKLPKQPKPETT